MAGKFVKISRIVFPFMTVVILASQLMGCAALPKDQFLEELQKADEVVIEYVEPDQTPLAGPSETGSSYDYETNTVSTSTEAETEAEIGLVEQAPEVPSELSASDLQSYFQLAYDTGKSFEGDIESRIAFELELIATKVDQDEKGTLPGDYATQYRNWRPYSIVEHFTSVDETVYATSQVNLRNGPGTNYDKLGSLSAGNSVHRIGIGTGDYSSWSRIELSDGTYAYVASSYLSTTKPVVQQQQAKTSGGGSTAAKPSGQSSGASSGATSSGGGASGGSEAEEGLRQAEAAGTGLAGLIGSKPIDTTQEGYDPETGLVNNPNTAVNMH